MRLNIIISGLLIITIFKYANGSCLGCVELDEITFDKLIRKFQYSLIKFDIAYPYGDKHEAFGEFSKMISPKVNEIFVGLVGVKDYGEKENSAIAQRYKIDDKKFPIIMLFKNYSTDNWIQYPIENEINTNNLKKFIRKHTNLYIGLDGCIETLDILAEGFTSKSQDEQEKLIEKVKEISGKFDTENEKEISKIYLIIMKRIMEKGSNFINEEQKRIENLKNGKITDNKKKELNQRLNILESFKLKDDENSNETKDEL